MIRAVENEKSKLKPWLNRDTCFQKHLLSIVSKLRWLNCQETLDNKCNIVLMQHNNISTILQKQTTNFKENLLLVAMFQTWLNWEALRKHAHSKHVSGNMFSRLAKAGTQCLVTCFLSVLRFYCTLIFFISLIVIFCPTAKQWLSMATTLWEKIITLIFNKS